MRNIKPTHKPIKVFYAELEQYENLGATNETEVRTRLCNALSTLRSAKQFNAYLRKTDPNAARDNNLC